MKLEYVEADALGTPRAVIDPVRNVAIWNWGIKNEGFGNGVAGEDADGDGTPFVFNMRFPGQRYDAASGLNYNYFRDYDASTGRYVESDLIGIRGGTSTYTYVGADPLTGFDPMGLYQCTYQIATHQMTCTPNNPAHPSFSSAHWVSGNNQSKNCQDCQNNPSRTDVSNHGPLPQGDYSIGPQHPSSSRRNLTPWFQLDGRSGFQIHGCGNPATCSEGCIAATTNAVRDLFNHLMSLEEGQNALTVGP